MEAGAKAPGLKKKSTEPLRLQGTNQVCNLTPLPGRAILPSPGPQMSPPGSGYRPQGAPWPGIEAGGVGSGPHPSVLAFPSQSPQRISSIILGVSRLPLPRRRPRRSPNPLTERPLTHTVLSFTAAVALLAPRTATARSHSPASPAPAPPSPQEPTAAEVTRQVATAASPPARLRLPLLPLPAGALTSAAAVPARALSRQSVPENQSQHSIG